MKKYLFLFLLLFPLLCQSYNWDNIGPAGIEANNFYLWGGGVVYELICASDGLWVNNAGNWQEYSYGDLPVWDVEAVAIATADLIAVMGDGSYSDGIYLFNFITFEFFISEWFFNPRFIYYCSENDYYYVGGEQGLVRSNTGTLWEPVTFFNNKYCLDMISYDDHFVVAADNTIFYSDDAGSNWNQSTNQYPISNIAFSQNGTLYGIFPDTSYSSGLWRSDDYGSTWEVEFWDMMMSSVCFDCNESLFVGWEEASGVAIWDPILENLSFMNDCLPDLNVNKLTIHPLINGPNIVCCTDGGVFILTFYGVNADDPVISTAEIEMFNYPNPFNPETTINYSIIDAGRVRIEIFNIKGEKIRTLVDEYKNVGYYFTIWNGKDNSGKTVASGMYFYNMRTEKYHKIRKMLLIK